MVAGSYATWMVASRGIDPILSGVLLMPVFFIIGLALYQFYYVTFESRGTDTGLRGIAFFFGIAFIVQVGLILVFGVDQRLVEAAYIGTSYEFGEWLNNIRIPNRMLVAFGVALALTVTLTLYLGRTFTGRAIKAVAQDEGALRLMGASSVGIKRWAFGIATATCALAGALLIIIGPVDPNLYQLYIGRTFCVVVLAGLGSMSGTILAGLILGVAESIVLSTAGTAWAPAVAFGILLLVLGVRPQGLFGR